MIFNHAFLVSILIAIILHLQFLDAVAHQILVIIIIFLIMIISSPLSDPLWAQLQICRHCSARQTSSCNPGHCHHDEDDDNDDDNGYDDDNDDDEKKYFSPVDNRACSGHLLRKSCRINYTWVDVIIL